MGGKAGLRIAYSNQKSYSYCYSNVFSWEIFKIKVKEFSFKINSNIWIKSQSTWFSDLQDVPSVLQHEIQGSIPRLWIWCKCLISDNPNHCSTFTEWTLEQKISIFIKARSYADTKFWQNYKKFVYFTAFIGKILPLCLWLLLQSQSWKEYFIEKKSYSYYS
jgi:hypothetical protein